MKALKIATAIILLLGLVATALGFGFSIIMP